MEGRGRNNEMMNWRSVCRWISWHLTALPAPAVQAAAACKINETCLKRQISPGGGRWCHLFRVPPPCSLYYHPPLCCSLSSEPPSEMHYTDNWRLYGGATVGHSSGLFSEVTIGMSDIVKWEPCPRLSSRLGARGGTASHQRTLTAPPRGNKHAFIRGSHPWSLTVLFN